MNIREWLTGKAKEEGVELDPADLEAAFSAGDVNAKLSQKDQEIAALKAEQERHAAEFARVATEKRQAEAVTFAQSQVAAHRVAPASAEPLAALVSHVASIDASATFAEGETSGTVLLQAFLASLPDLSVLTTEHIKGEGAAALFNQDTTPGLDGKEGEITPERIKALMAASPLGRAVLDSTTA